MSFHHKNLRLCVQFCIICHCGHRSHFLFPTTSYIRLKQEITEITRHGGVFYRWEMSVNKKCHREVIFLLINIESRHILLTIMHVNSLKKCLRTKKNKYPWWWSLSNESFCRKCRRLQNFIPSNSTSNYQIYSPQS